MGDMPDTTDTLMYIMDIGEGKEGQLKLKLRQHHQLTQRLILIICIEDTMATTDIPTDTMDTDTGEEKEDQQSLKQEPPLTPRLTLTCCMEDIMDTDTDSDTMDILMVDTTWENELPQQPNIKETPKYIVKSSA